MPTEVARRHAIRIELCGDYSRVWIDEMEVRGLVSVALEPHQAGDYPRVHLVLQAGPPLPKAMAQKEPKP